MHFTKAFAASREYGSGRAAAALLTTRLAGLCLFTVLAVNVAWSAGATPRQSLHVDPADIVPQSLGTPADCYDSAGFAMNNGAYPGSLVVGGASNCSGNKYPPFTWRNGGWHAVSLPAGSDISGGWVDSISDDHATQPTLTLTVMFNNGHNTGWVKMPGQPPAELPGFAGMPHAGRLVVSALGNHIVGSGLDPATNERRPARWTRSGAGWSAPEEVGRTAAVATTDDGSVVVGNGGWPWVWTARPGGGGDLVLLDDGAAITDITHNGSMLVGKRNKPCSNDNCTVFPGPVYWVVENGQWRMHDLEALDGVTSVAEAVAEVDGQAIIVGYGYTNQQGGILRPVVWIPESDGSYGAPRRLQPLGGAFESWADARDVNRNGIVLGVSDRSATDWTTVGVLWPLFEQTGSGINAGHSGAWFNPETAGQGQFIDVEPQSQFVFLSWFTYTEAAGSNPNQQHWFTAQGQYVGDTAELIVYETLGGRFDDPQAVTTTPVGEATLRFFDCGLGAMSYRLEHWGVEGTIPLQRVIPGSAGVCEDLDANTMQAMNINAGMDGAWYDPDAGGQGFFIDTHPDAVGGNFIFVSWFTFGDGTASGQRWLTAQGSFSGSLAEIDVYETTGGGFDATGPTHTVKVGTMSIDFSDCANAVMTYSLTDSAVTGEIGLTRVVPGSQSMCEALATGD